MINIKVDIWIHECIKIYIIIRILPKKPKTEKYISLLLFLWKFQTTKYVKKLILTTQLMLNLWPSSSATWVTVSPSSHTRTRGLCPLWDKKSRTEEYQTEEYRSKLNHCIFCPLKKLLTIMNIVLLWEILI